MLLTCRDVAVSYGITTVLHNISFTLNPAERMGLVGANGVGKSTLLKLIAQEIQPDAGEISVLGGVEVGYLPQEPALHTGGTLQTLFDDALAQTRQLAAQMATLEAQMAAPNADLPALFEAYDALTLQYQLAGGYDAETRLETVLNGLGVAHLARHRTLDTLSGGERARVALAAMLVRAPALLLLDEPTNHIDAHTRDWLEQTLMSYNGGLLVISHDRAFLNRTVNRILEIDEHTRSAKLYTGNYDAYAHTKRQQRQRWEQDYAAQQEEMHMLRRLIKGKAQPTPKRNIKTSDPDKFIKHFKNATADKTHARDLNAAEEKLRRLEADAIPRPPKPLQISPELDPTELRGKFPVQVHEVCKAYGEQRVLAGISLTVGAGERWVITGENGSGKSTLLQLIAGEAQPDSGTVMLAPSVRLGYLPQVDTLPVGGTLIETYSAGLAGTYEEHKAALIGSGFFTYAELGTPAASLSAGQRRKVQLARLMAARANVLLLDEPTNHISFDVLEGFEAALQAFGGTVIAVSHDRRFLQALDWRELSLEKLRQP